MKVFPSGNSGSESPLAGPWLGETFTTCEPHTCTMGGGVLGVIPARGGSKGLPKKNILPLCGKPLIGYTIEAAKYAAHVDRVVVSTEDAEIAKISRSFGADVIIRPPALATDTASTMDVVFHALDFIRRTDAPDLLILLQATSPLRTSQDIDAAVDLFHQSECDTVVSVCEPRHPPYWCFTLSGSYLIPLFGKEERTTRRQDLLRVLCPNGAIYIARPEVLRSIGNFFGGRTVPYQMPAERSIDIDTEIDFRLADILMRQRIADSI